MKNFSFTLQIINIILICSLFNEIINADLNYCVYQKEKGGAELTTETEEYLKDMKDDTSKKQACYDLSNSVVLEEACCYHKGQDKCVPSSYKETHSTEEIYCPESSKIYNNCGMAGFFQPLTSEKCTEISLVQGYCCFVETEKHGNGCVRTKKLNDDVNTTTEQIEDYVKGCVKEGEEKPIIKSIVCKGCNINYYWISLLISFILLF